MKSSGAKGQCVFGPFRFDLQSRELTKLGIRLRVEDKPAQVLACLLDHAGDAVTREELQNLLGERPLAEPDLAEVRSTVSDNPEAARWYAVGLEKLRGSDAIAAAECFQKVVALDANYSLGHARLATAWSRLGYAGKATAEAEKAFLLSQSLPRKDKLLIEAQYRESSYAWEEAIVLYNELFHSYPDSLEYGLRLAEAQTAASHGVDALETVRQLRKLPSPASTDARLDLAEADAAASLSDFRLQLQAADAAYKKGMDEGAHLLVARSETIRGDALRALGKPEGALAAWEHAEQIFSRAGDQGGITKVLNSRGLLLFRMTQIEQAKRTYQQSMEICRRLEDQACLARSMAGLGVVESYYGDGTVARNLLDCALATYGKIGNLQEEAYTLSLIADMILPDYAKAKPMYERSLELSRQANDRSRVAGRLMDLAIMHLVEGDLASAHKMLEEAASIHRSLGEKYREAACLHREGEVAAWQGDLPLARDLISRALAIRTQLDEPEYVAQALDTMAWVELQSGDLKTAEEMATKAMAEHDRAHGPIGVGIASEVMSEALLAEGRLSEAEAAYARAEQLVSPWKTGEAPVSLKVLKARLLAAQGRTSEAQRECREAIELAKKYHAGRVLMLASFSKAELDFGLHLESSADELRRFELQAQEQGFGLLAQKARTSLATLYGLTTQYSR